MNNRKQFRALFYQNLNLARFQENIIGSRVETGISEQSIDLSFVVTWSRQLFIYIHITSAHLISSLSFSINTYIQSIINKISTSRNLGSCCHIPYCHAYNSDVV